MIDINLLPQNMRKQVGLSSLTINIPLEYSLGIGGTFILLLVVSNILIAAACGYQSAIFVATNREWNRLEPTRKIIDSLNKESSELKNKVNTLSKEASTKNSQWSRRLNIISDNIAKGMWFKRFTFDGKSLVIEGYAVSKIQQDLTSVNSFVSALRNDAFLMNVMSSIDISAVTKEKRGMVDLTKYTIIAKMDK